MAINFLGAIHRVLVIRWQNWRLARGKAHHFSEPFIDCGCARSRAGHPHAPAGHAGRTGGHASSGNSTHHVAFDVHSHLTIMAEGVVMRIVA